MNEAKPVQNPPETPATPVPDTVINLDTWRVGPTTAALIAEEQPTDQTLVPLLATPEREAAPLLLSDIVAAIPHAVVVLDSEGRVMFWSEVAEREFGWNSSDVIGRPPPYLPHDGFSEHARQLVRARAGVRVRPVPTIRRHRDGRTLHVQVTMTAASGGGVVCVHLPLNTPTPTNPLTETPPPPRRSEQARRYEILGRLIAGVTHDVNQMLGVIDAHAGLLVQPRVTPAIAREYSEIIRASVRHASLLTNKLIDTARPSPRIPTPLDTAVVLDDLAPLIRAAVGSAVRCIITPGRRLPRIQAERSQFEQLVLNLVINARDAMPHGGTLGIRTSVVIVKPGQTIGATTHPGGEAVCLTIADSGQGIDDPTKARMFEPYFTTKGRAGVGLGLATVQEIVQLCQAQIDVQSEPDFGTVFRVYFPALPPAEPSPPDPLQDLPMIRDGQTVLLVDDEPASRQVAKIALETMGYSVIEARSGDEAARLARVVREPIDLLVTDVVMPGLNGRRLAERLRFTRPGLPVVYISGYRPAADAIEPRSVFLAKPLQAAQLRQAVESLTQQFV